MDIHYVHEAMEEPLIRDFLAKLEQEEIIPIVPPVPDTDLKGYFHLIERRLLNAKIGDTIARLAQDGSNRQPKFILPSTADRLARGQSITGLALVSALWCHYLAGTTEGGNAIRFNDPNIDQIRTAALEAKTEPLKFLAMDEISAVSAQIRRFKRPSVLHSYHCSSAAQHTHSPSISRMLWDRGHARAHLPFQL